MPKEQKSVVLVEDEPTLANLIELGLQNEGYRVVTKYDGQEGLDAILEEKPNLVLLDMMLPTLKGFDILERLAKENIIPAMPVVIISNSGEPVEVERALKLGVRDYLVKVNFDPEEVIGKVKTVFEKEERGDEAPERPVKKGKGGGSVLVIEDEEVLYGMLRRQFEEEGYDVSVATNAGEAKRTLGNKKVDIILLDLVLPDVNGLDFLKELKQSKDWKEIPVVIISNLGQKEDIENGMKAGAADYLVKADTVPEEICEHVEDILGKSRISHHKK